MIRRMIGLSALLGVWAVGLAQDDSTRANTNWSVYSSGTVCNITTAETTVILNATQFSTYWKRLSGSEKVPTDVDFTRDELIAINLGSRPTSGYSVSVSAFESPRYQQYVVTYTERRPGSRETVSNQASSPFVIMRVGRIGSRVTFKPITVDGGRTNNDNVPVGTNPSDWSGYMIGTTCNISTARTLVISTASDFQKYWSDLSGNSNTPRDVDFTKEQLVAINLGQRPTGGYAVSVAGIDNPRYQQFVVTYVERRPTKQEVVTTQLTSPFVIIRMPRVGNRITFKPITVDGGRSNPGSIDPGSDQIAWSAYTVGTVCNIQTTRTTVINSANDLTAYWRDLTGNANWPRDVDFTKEKLVAINLGSRASGGYSVSVVSVVQPNPNAVVITYVERRPGRKDKVDNQKSSPYIIIRMPRVGVNFSFKPMTIDGK